MYSYQHRYHAGNFADIHKHLCLLAILNQLIQKNTPFAVLDAYAGEGLYDLSTKEAQKNQEYKSGIVPLQLKTQAPDLIHQLLAIHKSYQAQGEMIYAGSPAIIKAMLRVQDRAILIENHPQAHEMLQKNFGRDFQLQVHKRDALEALNALLPFPEKRGLILIDPSYEVKDEYEKVALAVTAAYKKFAQGIYMVWYPILEEKRHQTLINLLKQAFPSKVFFSEFAPKEQEGRMQGSGIAVVNPPWKLDEIMADCLRYQNEQ